jgi:hypothetical protein
MDEEGEALRVEHNVAGWLVISVCCIVGSATMTASDIQNDP